MSSSVKSRSPEHGVKPVQQAAVHYPFWFGGSASCCAAAVTHPLDLGEKAIMNPELVCSLANILGQSR